MKKHVVTEDTEIILDGQKCLLEVGDTIQIISEQMWMQSQQILAIDAPKAVEAVTEMGDMEHNEGKYSIVRVTPVNAQDLPAPGDFEAFSDGQTLVLNGPHESYFINPVDEELLAKYQPQRADSIYYPEVS